MADDAATPTGELIESVDDVEEVDVENEAGGSGAEDSKPGRRPVSAVRLATLVGVVVVLALCGLTGWLGYRANESRQAQQQRDVFLQVARQGALNLTTIDWQHADVDIQRILDGATGEFYDDFSKRAQPFVDVVKKSRSKSEGTVTAAGLESETPDAAESLVAVSVDTTTPGAPEQNARAWRMRISVQKIGDQAKISNVQFVP